MKFSAGSYKKLFTKLCIGIGTSSIFLYFGAAGLTAYKLSKVSSRDVSKQVGISIDEIKKMLGKKSLVLTKNFGRNGSVFLISTDSNIEYVLKNYRDSTDNTENQEIETGAQWLQSLLFQNTVFNKLFDVTNSDWTVYRRIDNLRNPYVTAKIIHFNREEGGEKLFVIKPEYEFEETPFLEGFLHSEFISQPRFMIPFSTSQKEQIPKVFYHEMGHALDAKLDLRNYDAPTKGIIQESVGDTFSLLVSMRETKNKDYYYSVTRAERFIDRSDIEHFTGPLLDKIVSNIDLSDLNGLNNFQLSDMAVRLVDEAYLNMKNNSLHDFEEVVGGIKILRVAYLPLLHSARKAPNPKNKSFTMAIGFNRSALEASLQNLLYTKDLEKKSDDYIEAIKSHINRFSDSLAQTALESSTVEGYFDANKFAEKMGFSIDFEASKRRSSNVDLFNKAYLLETSVKSSS
ncbi:hypothetical protein ACI2KR_07915 [Pseudomonas luteola]